MMLNEGSGEQDKDFKIRIHLRVEKSMQFGQLKMRSSVVNPDSGEQKKLNCETASTCTFTNSGSQPADAGSNSALYRATVPFTPGLRAVVFTFGRSSHTA